MYVINMTVLMNNLHLSITCQRHMLCRRNILCLSRNLRQSNAAMERCEDGIEFEASEDVI